MIAKLARLWRTVRHLRPVQIYGRAWNRWIRPAFDFRPAPPIRPLAWERWAPPAEHEGSMSGPDRFRFLGQERGLKPGGWDDPAADKLWCYNLHYFADLTSVDAQAHVAWHCDLLVRWVRENPPGAGTAWEPFPTSIRMVNWIKWTLDGNELPAECVESLAVQARWLSHRLERHLLGNHLFANAKALFFAGLFFDGREADALTALAARILHAELAEQILDDGGHFERSTMYHALALEDVLDLCNIGTLAEPASATVMGVVTACRIRVDAMRSWLQAMSHPDGDISFFNDSVFGIAPLPAALERYAIRLGFSDTVLPVQGLLRLPASGYARLSNDSAVALVDVAPVGPDYLPGHAHADTLSFELSLFGSRIAVNSGTSCYGVSEERHRQRGTAAHNTVVIDGADSSEVWSGFRVGRRAHPTVARAVAAAHATEIDGAHDGYRYLPGAPIHRRRWSLRAGALIVTDHISGTFERAEARFHLHPSVVLWRAEDPIEGEIRLRIDGGRWVSVRGDDGRLRIEKATWHPRFGESIATLCVVASFAGPTLRTIFDWSDQP